MAVGLIVQKYGGTSVADPDRMRNVARHIAATREQGHSVVAVVSAMGKATDNLVELARQVSNNPHGREMDMLLTTGERISSALLCMALLDMGCDAMSFTGSQVGIITDTTHTKAKILEIKGDRVREALGQGKVAVVAGFQGVSTAREITTLGRGGSDTTAVALAAALEADVCEIYTDVDGVFSADPRIVPAARKLKSVTYDEMLELAASGAKVLHLRCVEYARRFELPIHVRSSFSNLEGTWVVSDQPEGGNMEQAIISGIAHDKSEAKITIVGVPDRAGVAARIFQSIADSDINIDMIVQNVSAAATGLTDISFTLPRTDGSKATSIVQKLQGEIGFQSIQYDDQIGKLSLIGAGMRSHPGVTATFFAAMADAGVNIEMISTSEIRISIVCRQTDLDRAVRAAHTAFELDADQVEAVVYGGSGR